MMSDGDDGNGGAVKTKLRKFLAASYDQAVNGTLGGVQKPVREVAEQALRRAEGDHERAIRSLTRWCALRTGGIGFAANLPGALTAVATIPVDFATTWYNQARLVAAIAHLRGYDLNDDQVRTLVMMVLIGDAPAKAANVAAVKVSRFAAIRAIKAVPMRAIHAVNRFGGKRLVTKWGETGVVNLSKAVPGVGGVVGGSVNATTTYIVSKAARRLLTRMPPGGGPSTGGFQAGSPAPGSGPSGTASA